MAIALLAMAFLAVVVLFVLFALHRRTATPRGRGSMSYDGGAGLWASGNFAADSSADCASSDGGCDGGGGGGGGD